MTFSDLNLIQPLLTAAQEAGYTQPTPIQEATIPLALAGHDILGCAQTGTGKTAAFAMPILQNLSHQKRRNRPIRALIVTPTRELALQIGGSFATYGAHLPLKCCTIFGGVKQKPQVVSIQSGVDILVATPGRLNDLIGQGIIHLDRLEIFVLDEADRMLDMGFINDIKRLMKSIPQKRQTLFFSATMPPDVEKLAMTMLTNPASVKVDPVTSTVDSIEQYLYYVDKGNKAKLLSGLLKNDDVKSALVFSRTKHGANKLVQELDKAGIVSMAIHGNKSQNARQDALHKFMTGEIGVLVATDIAARGIDIPELSHVFNYDIPTEAETYIHRIGRTGRAGLSGKAISFCCHDELGLLADIVKLTGKKPVELESPYPMQVLTDAPKKAQQPARKPSGIGNAQSAPRKRPAYRNGRQSPPAALKAKRPAAEKRAPAKNA